MRRKKIRFHALLHFDGNFLLSHFGKFSKGIDKVRKVMYNIKAVKFTAFIWTGIEEVITALTRNVVKLEEVPTATNPDFTGLF